MLLAELHLRKDAIESAARQYGARRTAHSRVWIGGAGRETPESDIDFLVDFPQGYDLFSQRLPLAAKLSELTGRHVDVVPEHELNPHIRQHVLAEARNL